MQSLILFLIIFYLILVGVELTIPEQYEKIVKYCLHLKYVRYMGLMPILLGLLVIFSIYKYTFKITWLLYILSFIYFSFGIILLLKPKAIVSFYEDNYFKCTEKEKKLMLRSDLIIMIAILSLLIFALI